MQLHVRFVNEGRSPNTPEMIQEILRRQLQRFEHRLKQVQVYIEDVNGPRGGVDKHCRCVLHLRRMAPIVISDSDSSVLAMVHRIADRASHALSRHLARQGQRSGTRAGQLSDSQLDQGQTAHGQLDHNQLDSINNSPDSRRGLNNVQSN